MDISVINKPWIVIFYFISIVSLFIAPLMSEPESDSGKKLIKLNLIAKYQSVSSCFIAIASFFLFKGAICHSVIGMQSEKVILSVFCIPRVEYRYT